MDRSDTGMKSKYRLNKSGLKRILTIYIVLIFQVAVLFISAGHFDVPGVWIFIAVSLVYQVVSMMVITRFYPQFIDLLNHRGEKKQGTKKWDKFFTMFYTVFFLMAPVVAGLDAGRFHWSDMSIYFAIPGVILYILAYILGQWAMIVNRHFETTVRMQKDREHRVISTGPYGIVRHPGYISAIMLNIAFPLIIGSVFTFIPVAVTVVLMLVRTSLEDKTLRNELDGYLEYSKRVKYRLLPGVW